MIQAITQAAIETTDAAILAVRETERPTENMNTANQYHE